jgi:acylphosphatase
MSDKTKCVQLHIRGRVQGVCYRMEAQNYAKGLGLTGWVKNCPDGSVEALAEGPRESLKQFITWCESGPGMARVENVHADWSSATGDYDDFEITH